ncbi:oligosaccharide flippase family protein [Lutimonas zeaxanthinifaciens]|uniref:oligosaccharide flippase family protein n=1 Tax=Lutimonas zeaxanthinifaciens TaxID=3060215 RepID=UPI00265D49E4|nr:oligosaccharide flippase family protein [Lutimonas sp. YSD2104]WKK66710.1 oligosaccharide flippase family protein [Lutimonas sp. YSD2104]
MKLSNLKNIHPDGKIVFKNFSFLSLRRLFNIISQYILISFLVRTLGSETYGIFVWAFSIIQYLVLTVNFGFNTYSARYISENRRNPEKTNQIFSAILTSKMILFSISTCLFLVFIYLSPVLYAHKGMMIVLLGFVLGEALFPLWFFQGKEILDTPVKIVFAFKLLLVVLTIILVSDSDDMIVYAILLSMSQLLIGMITLFFAVRKFNTRLITVTISTIKKTLKEGSGFFVSTLCTKSINLLVILIAGIYFTMQDVTSFDVSFKIIAAFLLPFETLSIALFPTIARTRDKKMNEKLIYLACILGVLMGLLAYWKAGFLLSILGGQELLEYNFLLEALSILIPVGVITYFLGTNTLVAFGYSKEFNFSIIIPSIMYILILLILWLMDSFTLTTIVYTRILVDLIIMVFRIGFAMKYKLIFSKI